MQVAQCLCRRTRDGRSHCRRTRSCGGQARVGGLRLASQLLLLAAGVLELLAGWRPLGRPRVFAPRRAAVSVGTVGVRYVTSCP